MNDPAQPHLRVLTVCTHNRTRSVMMAAMLERLLATELGVGAASVTSSGFGPAGRPAIPDAVEAMRRRGLDVSAHLSRETTGRVVDVADVILTAERDHVVKIAALSPDAFRRTMTLPEFLDLAAQRSTATEHDVRGRVVALTAGRLAGDYLRTRVPEVADPTGTAPRAFEAAVVRLEEQCGVAASRLADLLDPG